MTPGEWHEDVWCDDNWHEDMWTDYGTEENGNGDENAIITTTIVDRIYF